MEKEGGKKKLYFGLEHPTTKIGDKRRRCNNISTLPYINTRGKAKNLS